MLCSSRGRLRWMFLSHIEIDGTFRRRFRGHGRTERKFGFYRQSEDVLQSLVVMLCLEVVENVLVR
jgi:hypothetical protein